MMHSDSAMGVVRNYPPVLQEAVALTDSDRTASCSHTVALGSTIRHFPVPTCLLRWVARYWFLCVMFSLLALSAAGLHVLWR